MAGGSSSTPWGSVAIPEVVKNRGFFSLGSEGKSSPAQSRSFAEVLSSGSVSGESLPTLTQGVFNGFPAVLLSDEEVLKLASPYQFTLVGKFGLRRPNLDSIRNFFGNLKLSGFFSVGLLDSRHVAIQLSNDLDYSRVFARRSYFINACQMRILKWTPFFDIHEESPIVPVWISFPNLRLHFFNPKVLHALGSTDQATASRTRPSVARVLVEIDITKNHTKEIWVGSKAFGYLQKVEFENFPEFCSHCKMHGHALQHCFKLHPNLKRSSNSSVQESTEKENVDVPIDPTIAVMERNNIPADANVRDTVNDMDIPTNQRGIEVSLNEEILANPLQGNFDQYGKEVVSPKLPDEPVPNIFISVDSMLNISSKEDDNSNTVSFDEETEEVQNCEEGEILSNSYEKSNFVDTYSNDDNEETRSPRHKDNNSKYIDEEGFTKVGKKKALLSGRELESPLRTV
ncbi:hypothetical protein M5K25_026691 [Dendrobium thyrsiflorum]|uniref:DUF4283 domain-containing protein n=1 Tax=Dendrobium thyrsiflorum TaxID=117978 RepID=A0ABD0TXV1_DENTH